MLDMLATTADKIKKVPLRFMVGELPSDAPHKLARQQQSMTALVTTASKLADIVSALGTKLAKPVETRSSK